jgi:hypothetical protein
MPVVSAVYSTVYANFTLLTYVDAIAEQMLSITSHRSHSEAAAAYDAGEGAGSEPAGYQVSK